MKRFAILVLAVAMVGFAGQAWAGVQGSAHDVIASITALTNFGACSSCHIPHKSQGDRLWPAAIGGGAPERGEVGNLCTYCHDSGVSVIQRAAQDQVFKDLDSQTHGLIKANITNLGDTIDTTLPYGAAAAGTTIQCTSCHNVHDQSAAGRMAFLQDDIDVLCARCHQRRQWVGTQFTPAQGAWGTRVGFDPAGTAGNPGSHPIGTDITGDGSRHDINGTPASLEADSPIETGVIGIVAYGAPATYNLGPKLIDGGTPADASTFTGGIACVSCHAVHGINTAADGPTPGTPANPDLLAVNQSEMNGSANGGVGQDINNALCEACHRSANRMGSTTSYPNPGATVASHPVDDIYNMADAGVTPATLTALGWPTGASGANAAGPDIICESCHMPHPFAAANGAQTVPPLSGTNSHILRNTDASVCGNCHTGQVADHHPIGNGEMDGTLFLDNAIGDGDSDLECADCHNGNGAHNWTAMGAVGLDPDWEPWDNCRGTNDQPGYQCENMSKECMDCHLPATSRFSPTRPETPNANEYQDGPTMDASHFVGTPTTTLDAWTLVDTTAVTTGTTFVDGTWASTGWSRFAGSPTGAVTSAGQLVCESCHELQPGKNATGSDLLLHMYQEAYSEDRSYFCQGCHGLTGVVGNAHPQTGDTVGRATLAGRGTPATLITTPLPPALPTPPAITDSFAEWGDRGAAWYPAADQMNCNTCHQPHDAVTTSGTYILESTTGTTLPEVSGTPDTAVTMFGRSWANRRYVTHATPLNYQNFCNLCHRSGQ